MRKFASLILAAGLVAAACTDRETPQPPAPVTTATTTAPDPGPRPGGRLIRRLEGNINTLSYVHQGTEEERQVLQYIYDPMIDFNAELEPIAGTIARWEISEDGKTYTLHIDPRAKFSDGQPVTAADVLFTLGRILDEESVQFAAWYQSMDREQTKAVDEKTVRVVFKEALVPQLIYFNIGVLPKHVYEKEDLKKTTKVVGNGPYVLARRETGKNILLERNPNYWREQPYLDSVLFRVIADDSLGWSALTRGDVHVSRVTNDTWAREKDKPEVASKIAFHNTYQLSYNCIPWNLKDPLFADARVRRALAMAFDRNAVIEQLYHGQARAVSGPFTPDNWSYNPKILPIEFNLEGAAALFGSAGWTDSDKDGVLDREGKPFSFTLLVTAGSESSAQQAQIYQDALKKIGVQMAISALDTAAFFDRVLQGNFQAALLAWSIDPDPDPYSLFHTTQSPPAGLNVSSYSNAEVDKLLEQGRTTFDRARRTEIYHQIHEIVATDQPTLWMVQVGMKWGVDKRFQDVQTAKGVGLFLWRPGPYAWWLKEPN
jgi:peptide/nickel transport system substrate-binding protein